jgi:hypothetical protein
VESRLNTAREIDLRFERLAGAEPLAIAQEPLGGARLAGGRGNARQVHGDVGVVERPQGVVGRQRLGVGQVEDGRGDAPSSQRLAQGVLIDAIGAGEIDQHRLGFHGRQLRRADHPARLGRAGDGEDDPVEVADPTPPVARAAAGDGHHLHAEADERALNRLPDRAMPQDQRAAAGEVARAGR